MRHKKLTLKEKRERQIAPKHSDSTRVEKLLGGSSFHRELNEKRQENEKLEYERQQRIREAIWKKRHRKKARELNQQKQREENERKGR